jgi:hypothetical protein
MDGHRLTLVNKGKVQVFDFDGTNRQTLTAALDGTDVLFDQAYQNYFSIGSASSKNTRTNLNRVNLIVR